jgi:Leucine-rich repeat (LRR) protein
MRKATPRQARDAFAATLTRLMAFGQAPTPAAKRKRWTDDGLAGDLAKLGGSASPRAVANWRQGKYLPETVDPLIAAFFGAPPKDATAAAAFREAYDRAQAEKTGSVFAEAKLPGLQWTRRGDQLTFQAGEPSDAAAAQDRNRRQLQTAVAEHAKDLAERAAARAAQYGNMETWKKLPPDAAAFAAFIALPPEEIADHLGEGYAACLLLGRLANTDDDSRRGAGLPDPPLDRDLRDGLIDVLRLAAPWLRGFPLVAGWDDDAGKLLARQLPSRESVEIIIRSARNEGAIANPEADALFALVRAGDARSPPSAGPPDLAEKAARLSAGGVTNLMLSLAEIEAAERAGLLAPEDAEGRRLALRAAAIRRAAQLGMEDFDLTEDVRAALQALAAGPPAPKTVAAVPLDVEHEAHNLILRGVAPPVHWRPHILELNFAGTNLADTEPLAGLTALADLSLWRTQIADATPLAGLTALKSLNLSLTQVADAAPLAGLTELTALHLASTKIANAAPLAGLSALMTLDLSATKIADAGPLASLTDLMMLKLTHTKIADVAPLAGHTALIDLYLANTLVADVSPLAKLTRLRRLNLSQTRVADLSPLANLTNLKTLFLVGTPAADLAPLAGLIANGLEIQGKRVPAKLRSARETRPPIRPPTDQAKIRPRPRNP